MVHMVSFNVVWKLYQNKYFVLCLNACGKDSEETYSCFPLVLAETEE